MAVIKLSRKKAHQTYKTKDGKIVPGGSTIAKIADSFNPRDWYYNMGVQGIDPEEYMREAGGIGTVAHFMAECHFNGNVGDFSEFTAHEIEVGTMCYEKFLRVWQEQGLEWISSEQQLVSEEHRYGGTLDIIARKNGELVLADIKTSPQIYPSMLRQLAAYENLWNENNDEKIAQRVIIRLDKRSPKKTDVRWLGELSTELRRFLARLGVYYADKE